jgi:hypothetical protein
VYPPLPDAEVVELLETAVGAGPWRVELVGQSSNDVYRCEGVAETVAVRIPRVRMDALSSFWRQLREVFGCTFPPSVGQFRAIAAAVTDAGLRCPRLIAAMQIDGRPAVITEWLPGEPWEPDRFPSSGDVHRALGAFLARMHDRGHDGFGAVGGPLRPAPDYHHAAMTSARNVVESAWSGGAEELVSSMDDSDPAAVASSFAMIMPDIAGNQFLFDGDAIAGVVDLDSYVIGPIELELTVAEWCLVDPAAFAEGYEAVRPLPRFEPFRRFHRATMLVNEEAVAGDVDRLLEEHAFFD